VPSDATDVIFFIGAGFSKMQAALSLKRIWAFYGEVI